jgi:hypothetical protein
MHLQPLADDVGDRHARAERPERILKHHLHVAPERAHFLGVQSVDLARPADLAGRGDHAHQGETERRLARAALANDAERLALAHGYIDPVHRLDVIDRAAQQPCLTGNQTLTFSAATTMGLRSSVTGGSPLGSAASRCWV